jgi:hypothetical protein
VPAGGVKHTKAMKIILAFIIGAIISGGVVWQLITSSGERVVELLMIMNDTTDADFYSELQKVDDSEVKCFLAKHAASIASELNEDDAAKSPLLGPPGLGPVAARNIVRVKERLKSSGAAELASNCSTHTKLFK